MFTYMEEDVYRLAIGHAKDNPFRRYLEFLLALGELTPGENRLYRGIGREFINLLETTSMSKVYKMPVLRTFYNRGNVLMEVTEEQLLTAWKEFFNTGTNWKDLDQDMKYEDYCAISDRSHIKKILQMPVRFLQESGKGFFIKKEGVPLALCDDLKEIVEDTSFRDHFRDVIEFRTMDYYKRRYQRA